MTADFSARPFKRYFCQRSNIPFLGHLCLHTGYQRQFVLSFLIVCLFVFLHIPKPAGIPPLPGGDKRVAVARRCPGVSCPWHAVVEEEVLLCHGQEGRTPLLPPSIQPGLEERQKEQVAQESGLRNKPLGERKKGGAGWRRMKGGSPSWGSHQGQQVTSAWTDPPARVSRQGEKTAQDLAGDSGECCPLEPKFESTREGW